MEGSLFRKPSPGQGEHLYSDTLALHFSRVFIQTLPLSRLVYRKGQIVHYRESEWLILREDVFAVFLQYFQEADAQHAAGDDFANSHSEHEIRDSALEFVGISQHEGDDDRIGDNGGKRGKKDFDYPCLSVGFCAPAEKIGAKRAQKGSQTSK